MFTSNFIKSIFLVLANRFLLRGKLLAALKLVLQPVYAVRIPGGLTPP
jgi:hypothetical protein